MRMIMNWSANVSVSVNVSVSTSILIQVFACQVNEFWVFTLII